MPDPVALYSSVAFDAQELITFVGTLHIEGTKIFINRNPYRGNPDNAQVVRGTDQYVYISLATDMLEEDYVEKEELEKIRQFLGAEPKTCVVLDIGKYDPGSQLLGLEIASMLLEHWPGIIDVLRKIERRYLTRDDILALYEKELSFLGRPIFPASKGARGKRVVKRPWEGLEAG